MVLSSSLDDVLQDLATQIYFWDFYRMCCKRDGKPLGRYLSVDAAEFLSGALLSEILCAQP